MQVAVFKSDTRQRKIQLGINWIKEKEKLKEGKKNDQTRTLK